MAGHLNRGGALVGLLAIVASACHTARGVEAGFWFEPVSFQSSALGGPLTADDMDSIAAVARRELATAFHGLNITLSDRRDARYSVRVVQELLDHRIKRKTWIAGAARGTLGLGGSGAVSFLYFASGAVVYAPPGASRAEIVEAIGRGVGRGAVHELAHQLLPRADIHMTRDRASYEFDSASRPEQYFGEMRWDVAAPLLEARLSRRNAGHVLAPRQ